MLSRRELAAIAVVALAARTFNLGTFSLWLDEILLALRAHGSLADTWAACRANGEHPPLSALAMNVLYDLGAGDTLQRFLPVAFSVATVVMLATWAARHFGRHSGLATGLVMALTATQVRYAQELRPYAYLLFFVALALHAADSWRERRRAAGIAFLAGALAGGFYSHYLAALAPPILAPLMLRRSATGGPTERRARLRRLAGLTAATILALLAFAPWLTTMATVAGRPAKGGTAHWSLPGAVNRWEVLTVGMRDGDTLSWAGVLTLVLALAGCGRAARTPAGWTVITGAVTGTVGVELLLLRAHHWSSARYDLLGAMFLAILIGIGAGWLAGLGPRPLPALAVLAVLALVAWRGLERYASFGRPSWDRVAAAVLALRGPGEAVFTANEWSRVSLAYYLQGRDFEQRTGDELAPIAVRSHTSRLAERWPAAQCALMVAAGSPLYPPLEVRLSHFPLLAHFPSSDEARIYLLTPELRQSLFDSGWLEVGPAALFPAACRDPARLLPMPLRVSAPYPLTRLFRALGAPDPWARETVRLDFDRSSTAPALARGWSSLEKDPWGRTFAWALGTEAIVSLICDRPRPRNIRLLVQPASVPGHTQTIAAFLNGAPIGGAELAGGFRDVWFEAGAEAWRRGENLLTLRFAYATSPQRLDPAAADTRPLAAAVDLLELVDPPPPAP